MNQAITILAFIFLTLYPLVQTQAHGSGASLEKEAGEYIIDIGYNVFELAAEDLIRFEFDLLTKENRESVPVEKVHVRVARDGKTTFAATIGKGAFGKMGMAYVFPQKGNYTFEASYEGEENTLAEASFPLEVNEPYNQSSIPANFLIGIAVGILIGVLGALYVKKTRV